MSRSPPPEIVSRSPPPQIEVIPEPEPEPERIDTPPPLDDLPPVFEEEFFEFMDGQKVIGPPRRMKSPPRGRDSVSPKDPRRSSQRSSKFDPFGSGNLPRTSVSGRTFSDVPLDPVESRDSSSTRHSNDPYQRHFDLKY